MSARTTVLLVGSGHQRYREYLMASIAHEHDIWLLDVAEPRWQARHLVGFTVLDPFDERGLVAAARTVARTRSVAGVVCYDEALILPAAHVVEALGIPGAGVDAVRRCRDKLATRQALAAAGLPQPQSIAVTSRADAAAAARRVGYPVVLKPRGLGASQGVVVAADAGALDDAFAVATAAEYPGVPRYPTILVEEFVDGPEISIDGFVADGDYQILFVARKQLGLEPYFEEIGHIVDAADPLLHDPELERYLAAIHRALAIERGMTHTEIKLTSRGPRLIEVNGRLGGDLIPFIGREATGVDPGEVAAAIAVGGRPEVCPRRQRCVGIRFCYPPVDCRVLSVALPRTGAGLVAAEALVEPGDAVRLPPNAYAQRIAYVICEGDDPPRCNARLDDAVRGVQLRYEALQQPVAEPSRVGA